MHGIARRQAGQPHQTVGQLKNSLWKNVSCTDFVAKEMIKNANHTQVHYS